MRGEGVNKTSTEKRKRPHHYLTQTTHNAHKTAPTQTHLQSCHRLGCSSSYHLPPLRLPPVDLVVLEDIPQPYQQRTGAQGDKDAGHHDHSHGHGPLVEVVPTGIRGRGGRRGSE